MRSVPALLLATALLAAGCATSTPASPQSTASAEGMSGDATNGGNGASAPAASGQPTGPDIEPVASATTGATSQPPREVTDIDCANLTSTNFRQALQQARRASVAAKVTASLKAPQITSSFTGSTQLPDVGKGFTGDAVVNGSALSIVSLGDNKVWTKLDQAGETWHNAADAAQDSQLMAAMGVQGMLASMVELEPTRINKAGTEKVGATTATRYDGKVEINGTIMPMTMWLDSKCRVVKLISDGSQVKDGATLKASFDYLAAPLQLKAPQ